MESKRLSQGPALPAFFTLLVTLLLSSCAALIGPSDVEFPLAKLQQSVDKQLPFSQRYMGLFEVTASKAKLVLPAGQYRLSINTDVTIALPMLVKHGAARCKFQACWRWIIDTTPSL